jgi:hypothetical protein
MQHVQPTVIWPEAPTMWAIRNRTPYKVGKTWRRDKNGVHEWIVAVKATYDIRADGRTVLADEQFDPLLLPQYNGKAGSSSLRYDADLVARKSTTDVVVNGTACAPMARASGEFMVSLRVGPIHKVLRVRGDRQWVNGMIGLKASAPEPIVSVPITYERAYGGYDHADPDCQNHRMDARNPVGCGVHARLERRIGQPLPNFEYPQGNLEKDGPAGFGAIDSFWSPRREYCGTYDQAWQENRFPLLPEDWDARSLLCSPVDQRPPNPFIGREPVELVNLTPQGHLSFLLPRVHLTFRTEIAGRFEEHRGSLATVIIEPDHPRVSLVWVTSLVCRTDVDYLEKTVVDEKRMLR